MKRKEIKLDEGEQIIWWERRRPGLRAAVRMSVTSLWILILLADHALRLSNTGLIPGSALLVMVFGGVALVDANRWIAMASTEFMVTTKRVFLSTPTWELSTFTDRIETIETCGPNLALNLSQSVMLIRFDAGWFNNLPLPLKEGVDIFPVSGVSNIAGLISDLRREGVLSPEVKVIEHPSTTRATLWARAGFAVFLGVGMLLVFIEALLVALGIIVLGGFFLLDSTEPPWSQRLLQ